MDINFKIIFMRKIFILISAIGFTVITVNAQLVVLPDTNVIQLVNNFVLGGVATSNIQYSGFASGTTSSIGSFSNGNSTNLGLSEGIIMCTGAFNNFEIGSPVHMFLGNDNSSAGCAELDTLAGVATYDASILEFDLVPAGNILEFQYVFSSEEYPEFVNVGYNDVFGFFINGINPSGGFYSNQNIAIIPGTTLPVAINNVNATTNSAFYIDNEALLGQTIIFDGFTTVLLAKAEVIPNNTYHLKLAIADATDGSWDSGIFLKAQSMKSYNSTTEIKNIDNYKVYLSLSNDKLVISNYGDNAKNGIVTIINTNGQIVMSSSLQKDNLEFDVSSLSKGLYLVKIISDNSSLVTKFIK
jgi:hypothetical protein